MQGKRQGSSSLKRASKRIVQTQQTVSYIKPPPRYICKSFVNNTVQNFSPLNYQVTSGDEPNMMYPQTNIPTTPLADYLIDMPPQRPVSCMQPATRLAETP